MVFDASSRASFEEIRNKWEPEMKRNGMPKNAEVFLIANKVDVGRIPDVIQDAQKYAKSNGWEFFETSAAEGSNVPNCFNSLFSKALAKQISLKKKNGLM